MSSTHHIVIVGGGFAGVTTAIKLARQRIPGVQITLITPGTYLVYQPGLFHLLTGFSVKQLAIPYDYIFEGTGIVVEHDTVTSIDLTYRHVCMGDDCRMGYDTLIVSPGSVVNYYDMHAYAHHMHTVSTVDDTLRLRRSIHEMLTRCHYDTHKHTQCGGEVVIVGAGPNGTESAAEIALLTRQIASSYQIDPTQIKVTLMVSGDRVTQMFDQRVSVRLAAKLTELGVAIAYDTRLTPEVIERDHMDAIRSGHKIIVWSAGSQLAPLTHHIPVAKDQRGRALVDEHLHPTDIHGRVCTDVYIAGDFAATRDSGLAQTAQWDASYIASDIAHVRQGRAHGPYHPVNMGYIIAMGRDWALWTKSRYLLWGRTIWYLRRLVDLKSYLQFLPLTRALSLVMSDHERWDEYDRSARQHMEEKYGKRSK